MVNYYVRETVDNKYCVRGIELEDLQDLFIKHNTRNVWEISRMYPHISVDLEDSCLDFIDTDFSTAEID